MASVNTFAVETVRGVRAFHLHQGDICDSTDDVIVASSHTSTGIGLTGQVIDALSARHGCDFRELEPLLVPEGLCGTFRVRKQLSTGQTVLLVRMPSAFSVAQEDGEPMEVVRHALWTLFGSMAALELKGHALRSVSLPVMAARQGYPIRDLLEVIIKSAIGWLRASQATESVSLYVYEPFEFAQWYDEMDRVLGRKYFQAAKHSIMEGLRQELLSTLKRTDGVGSAAGPATWVPELRDALTQERLTFNSVALPGRKLAEFVADHLADHLGLPKYTKNGKKLRLVEMIEAINKKNKVALWVTSYLDSLRIFGNMEAHSQDNKDVRPRAISEDDLVALMCCVNRVVQIWLDWDEPEDAPAVPMIQGLSPSERIS